MQSAPRSAVIILAAGLGKRMCSRIPKVLHTIGGQPLLFHILDRVLEVAPNAPVSIVTGYAREEVEARVRSNPDYAKLLITFVHQAEQKGTGHAARCAMDSEWGVDVVKKRLAVLVLPGDLPLIPTELVRQMLMDLRTKTAVRLLTCELTDPTGYGRIVRRGKRGAVLRIAEEKDATARERSIREVGTSIYLFHAAFLKAGLHKITTKNAQGEYYLTDLVAQASRSKGGVDVLTWDKPEDLRGVNDPWELAQAGKLLNVRSMIRWSREGVRFVDPSTSWVDVHVKLAADVEIQPGVILSGRSEIGTGAIIKAGSIIEDSVVGPGASIGPYAHLRPGSVVGEKAKIGNFVELKKAKIGATTSVAHLSYIGDAEVGERVNIGCGFITCNFDGRVIDGERKHRTVIEDDVFLGSDCQTIAPVRVGRGAYVASGSTITEDVEPDALAIARSRQVNKPGYARKLRSGE